MADMDKRKLIAMDAQMEGEATVVKSIGRMVKLSEMEVIVLCNLAYLCSLEQLAIEIRDSGESALDCEAAAARHAEAMRQHFTKDSTNGLHRLVQSCMAMLGQERFMKYLVPDEQEEEQDTDSHG